MRLIVEGLPGEERGGYPCGRARLLVAPGGRCQVEYGDEPAGASLLILDDAPPFPELSGPSGLLSGFALEVRGSVIGCGRDARAVVTIPRAGRGHGPGRTR